MRKRLFFPSLPLTLSLFFYLTKLDNSRTGRRGSFPRLNTFPFCPPALAHFIQQTCTRPVKPHYSLFQKNTWKRERYCFHIREANSGDSVRLVLRLVRTSSRRLTWVIHWFSNSVNTWDQLQHKVDIVRGLKKRKALFYKKKNMKTKIAIKGEGLEQHLVLGL